jgi:hypothetical protein
MFLFWYCLRIKITNVDHFDLQEPVLQIFADPDCPDLHEMVVFSLRMLDGAKEDWKGPGPIDPSVPGTTFSSTAGNLGVLRQLFPLTYLQKRRARLEGGMNELPIQPSKLNFRSTNVICSGVSTRLNLTYGL